MKKNRALAIDFDGTIVEHKYPEIGEPLPYAFDVLKQLKKAGYTLILNTCREDDGYNINRQYLSQAVEFCRKNGVEFDAVNSTPIEREFRSKNSLKRKIYADFYIDDAMLGGFPGWETVGRVLLQDWAMVWACSRIEPPHQMLGILKGHGETLKCKDRRLQEGWFEKYAPEDKPGIDIGCKYDPLNETFRRWDLVFGDGDATEMAGVKDESFFTVYASHILEHIKHPMLALQNWYRILKPGGHLIVVVPHRDLYERKKELPSDWNESHCWFFLPDRTEEPCTLSLKDLVEGALPDGKIVSYRVLDYGYDYNLSPERHPVGEYSIEVVVQKL